MLKYKVTYKTSQAQTEIINSNSEKPVSILETVNTKEQLNKYFEIVSDTFTVFEVAELNTENVEKIEVCNIERNQELLILDSILYELQKMNKSSVVASVQKMMITKKTPEQLKHKREKRNFIVKIWQGLKTILKF